MRLSVMFVGFFAFSLAYEVLPSKKVGRLFLQAIALTVIWGFIVGF
jgi:hypothetical protein